MEMSNMGGSSSIAIQRRDLLEYKRGNGDEGWYIVSIGLHNGKLVIHYETSPGQRDEVLDLAEFETAENLHAKFRRPSTQLKDEECEKVMPLWPVLVAYPPPAYQGRPLKEAVNIPNTAGYRYFDARIEEISRVEHINAGGKEKCLCAFKIIWLAGPEVGQTATVQCKSIYLLGFRSLEKHCVLREAAKFVNGKKYTSIDKDTFKAASMAMTSVSVPEMTKVSKKSFENHLVRPNKGLSIITDENGYIVCSTQKSSLLEYKPDNGDDGWYIVSISLSDGKLTVSYERLAEEREEEFDLGKLKNAEDLYLKFRVPSTQLKDEECRKMVPMTFVMASYLPPADHGGHVPNSSLYKYYDACIEKVFQSNHITIHGQEKCMCTFEITWLGGPNVWQRANVYCENIYLPTLGSIEEHPVLKEATKFLQSREYRKAHDMHKDVTLKTIYKSDFGFASSSYFPSTIVPVDTNIWENNIEDHLVRSSNKRKVTSSNKEERSCVVITEDENGFIVCSTQKEK